MSVHNRKEQRRPVVEGGFCVENAYTTLIDRAPSTK